MSRSLPLLAALLLPGVAAAHISISSGPGFANTSQEITFGVGHGCAGSDTLSVRVIIPAGVTSVRPLPSAFGKPTVERDVAGNVTAVSWERDPSQLVANDDNYYKLSLRAKLPDAPFTKLYFPTLQRCIASDGGTAGTDWVATPANPVGEPAPMLVVVPARYPGWNRFTVSAATNELGVFFPDALIVWKGNAAFSPNPRTAEQIAGTEGTTALTELAAGDEIWVKY